MTNVTAEYVEDPAETKALLEKQISSSVRWQQSVENMIRQGVDTFIEIGPGDVYKRQEHLWTGSLRS